MQQNHQTQHHPTQDFRFRGLVCFAAVRVGLFMDSRLADSKGPFGQHQTCRPSARAAISPMRRTCCPRRVAPHDGGPGPAFRHRRQHRCRAAAESARSWKATPVQAGSAAWIAERLRISATPWFQRKHDEVSAFELEKPRASRPRQLQRLPRRRRARRFRRTRRAHSAIDGDDHEPNQATHPGVGPADAGVHWLLAASFLGAFVTAESERYRDIHVVLGYTVLGLGVFRLLWA